MLINSFFNTTNLPPIIEGLNKETPVEFSVGIKINSDHNIFKGHFPGKPIVPGVTYIEMIREIMELVIKKKILLKEASNIKFLSVTNPVLNSELNVSFSLIMKEENFISTKVLITSENGSVIKFNGLFSI
jgi:3-hydroxyacyl-[acyl-carrier-protein] dehydratase